MEKFLEEFDSELKLDEFQPVIGYRDIAKSPFVVTTQTNRLLELFRSGLIFDLSPGEEYLKKFTLGYISNAEDNCDYIFDKNGKPADTIDVESREVAAHAYTVFSWLPDMTAIPAIPALRDGLARNGVLKAPLLRGAFLRRTGELRAELSKIADGKTNYKQRPKLGSPLFRTIVFFKVAELLNPSFKLTVQERAVIQRKKDIKFLDKFSNPEIS